MSDAVVVGSGPNGLAGALELARAGLSVEVHERAAELGGGLRSGELTLPGFLHDICSTVHPLAAASPFFARTPLPGVELLRPRVAFAHPLENGRAAYVTGSLEETAQALGADARAYRRLLGPLVADSQKIVAGVLAPLLAPPAHPLALARFGMRALWPASALSRAFRGEQARALIAGLAAHSMRPLGAPGTGAFALLLGTLAHSVGWPVIAGGSARLAEAMAAELRERGATLHTDSPVADLAELTGTPVKLLDLTPRQLLAMAGGELSHAHALRGFRYGPGVCKVDWALSGPVPWSAAVCRETATLHLGGTFEEIAAGEAAVVRGEHAERPFCIVVQPCVPDPSRAPAGEHTLYAYCHVPSGSTLDVADRIQAQVERFAPGFGELVRARVSSTAAQVEAHNPNYVGGDINSGAATLRQTVLRPTPSVRPYATPLLGVYLCSASTPPGGGVHGMCGAGAAKAALKDLGHPR